MTAHKQLCTTGSGGPEVLALRDVPELEAAPGELLVEVHGAGLNRADLLQRAGHYPAPAGAPAEVLGLEYAGRVSALGAGVEGWGLGDSVMGLVGGGAMSGLLRVPADEALRVPSGLSLHEAAALPEAFLTAFDALVLQGELRAGELVLVHAVGSGVGTAALQLVVALGAHCVGTSRSAWKLERCAAHGLAHPVLVESPEQLVERVRAACADRRPDLVLQTLGAAYLPADLALLAPRGRLIQLGLLAGRRAEVDLGLIVGKRLVLRGSVLRGRDDDERRLLTRVARDALLPLFESGALRPVLADVLPMSEAAHAHERLAANEVFGKLVLDPRH